MDSTVDRNLWSPCSVGVSYLPLAAGRYRQKVGRQRLGFLVSVFSISDLSPVFNRPGVISNVIRKS